MTALQEALGRAFPPEYAAFGQRLRLSARDAVPLAELLSPAGLAPVTARYALCFPGAERRAVLSMWSQHYLLVLVPAAVAAAMAAGQDLPLALDGMGATLSGSGCPETMCLPHGGCPAAGFCPAGRLTPLLRTHLQPLAERLAVAGLPPRVLWGNAATVLAWALGVVTAPPDRVAAVRRTLSCPRWVDGGANPFCAALCVRDGCGPSRRVCCLRYRLPGVADCPDCPRGPDRAGPRNDP